MFGAHDPGECGILTPSQPPGTNSVFCWGPNSSQVKAWACAPTSSLTQTFAAFDDVVSCLASGEPTSPSGLSRSHPKLSAGPVLPLATNAVAVENAAGGVKINMYVAE